MTRLFDVEKIEHVCSCGRRDPVGNGYTITADETFDQHMAEHFWRQEQAVRWVEIDGQPVDRKPVGEVRG